MQESRFWILDAGSWILDTGWSQLHSLITDQFSALPPRAYLFLLSKFYLVLLIRPMLARLSAIIAATSAFSFPLSTFAQTPQQLADAELPSLLTIYKDLHTHPELSTF